MKEQYPQRRLLRKENAKLSRESTRMYWSILGSACKDLLGFEGFKTAVKNRCFVSLIAEADSLSSQLYGDLQNHYVANQLAALVKKYPYPGVEKIFDPEKVAFEKFIQSEARCRKINRLLSLRRSLSRDGKDSVSFQRMRDFIQYVIGVVPPLQKILDECYFGPGASIGVHGNATNAARKLLANWSVSPSSLHYFYAATMRNAFMRRVLFPAHDGFTPGGSPDDNWEVFMKRVDVVHTNKIEFVPKTVKTYRSIAVEPLGNGFVQGGISRVMRKNLKRIGIDLSDQSRNQEMARAGSLDDSPEGWVTLDLSSASDSISIELVRSLLPPEWFALLDATRSKNFTYRGETRVYEKFSSMGNGFCFPLQTLLFSAVCVACNAGKPGIDFQVFGDDIIVRKKFFPAVSSLLFRCGFKLNLDKTHVSGPFRESCGADWFGGVDVRPYTLDEGMMNVPAIYKYLNATRSKPLWGAFFSNTRVNVLRILRHEFLLYRPFQGQVDTGIDAEDEHLSSPYCHYIGNGVWRWLELGSTAVADRPFIKGVASQVHDSIMMYAALGGLPSSKPFTLRRKTKTTMMKISHGGATSQWLPTPSAVRRG